MTNTARSEPYDLECPTSAAPPPLMQVGPDMVVIPLHYFKTLLAAASRASAPTQPEPAPNTAGTTTRRSDPVVSIPPGAVPLDVLGPHWRRVTQLAPTTRHHHDDATQTRHANPQ